MSSDKSTYHLPGTLEAGCDEAGRGCLAGPVFAATVIFPPAYENEFIMDSKKLKKTDRNHLRLIIEKDALAFGVAFCTHQEIDRINILNASILSMHKALDKIKLKPNRILVDGNKFKKYKDIPHQCIIGGDASYLSIAAASILAKTYRDDFMEELHLLHPEYGWNQNKAYATLKHRQAIAAYGLSPYHRLTFNRSFTQLRIFPEQ